MQFKDGQKQSPKFTKNAWYYEENVSFNKTENERKMKGKFKKNAKTKKKRSNCEILRQTTKNGKNRGKKAMQKIAKICAKMIILGKTKM